MGLFEDALLQNPAPGVDQADYWGDNSGLWGSAISDAPQANQETSDFSALDSLPQSRDLWGMLSRGTPSVSDSDQSYSTANSAIWATGSGGGFWKGVGDFLGQTGKKILGALSGSGPGGTMEMSPANQYSKVYPAASNSQSQSAGTDKSLLIVVIVAVIAIVLVFLSGRK